MNAATLPSVRWGKRDTLLVIAVMAIALLVLGGLLLFSQRGAQAEIRVDGALVQRVSLAQDGVFVIAGVDGGQNTVTVSHGQVSVTEADCPDKLCVHHRPVSRTGESIICLPHKVTVTVVGGDNELDAVI